MLTSAYGYGFVDLIERGILDWLRGRDECMRSSRSDHERKVYETVHTVTYRYPMGKGMLLSWGLVAPGCGGRAVERWYETCCVDLESLSWRFDTVFL